MRSKKSVRQNSQGPRKREVQRSENLRQLNNVAADVVDVVKQCLKDGLHKIHLRCLMQCYCAVTCRSYEREKSVKNITLLQRTEFGLIIKYK